MCGEGSVSDDLLLSFQENEDETIGHDARTIFRSREIFPIRNGRDDTKNAKVSSRITEPPHRGVTDGICSCVMKAICNYNMRRLYSGEAHGNRVLPP